MPDGGFRPGYNVQLATTTQGGVIVGADLINQGSDCGQLTPMVKQLDQCVRMKPRLVQLSTSGVQYSTVRHDASMMFDLGTNLSPLFESFLTDVRCWLTSQPHARRSL
jgi:hypothetical protein